MTLSAQTMQSLYQYIQSYFDQLMTKINCLGERLLDANPSVLFHRSFSGAKKDELKKFAKTKMSFLNL